jgi:hypothetical protein
MPTQPMRVEGWMTKILEPRWTHNDSFSSYMCCFQLGWKQIGGGPDSALATSIFIFSMRIWIKICMLLGMNTKHMLLNTDVDVMFSQV